MLLNISQCIRRTPQASPTPHPAVLGLRNAGCVAAPPGVHISVEEIFATLFNLPWGPYNNLAWAGSLSFPVCLLWFFL